MSCNQEGTRFIPKENDHKISFHFVFQIVVSSVQFKLLYHHMADILQKECSSAVAAALNIAEAPEDEGQRCTLETEAMQDPLWGALVGMDMHPSRNVYQVRFLTM